MSKERLVIGTRGSALARWQANAVAQALAQAFPHLSIETKVITTTGDVNLDTPLGSIGDKGLFTKELEGALLAGEVDLCVHSMKDLPSELPEGCALAAMLPRADARDVLVCGPRIAGAASLGELPAGTRLGTGSARRVAQLRAHYPQLAPLSIRGNVDTRLAKACGADYDGAILAAAGITRLGRKEAISSYIPVDEIIPAVGQGAVGVEVRAGDVDTIELCAAINDESTWECVMAERQVLAALEGGCQAPIGVHARFQEDELLMDAIVLDPAGERFVRVSRRASREAPAADLAAAVLAELSERGAHDLLEEAL